MSKVDLVVHALIENVKFHFNVLILQTCQYVAKLLQGLSEL